MERSEPGTGWHALPGPECLRRLASSADGLSGAEAAARLAREGPNVFQRLEPVSARAVLAAQVRGVLTWLLVAAAAIAALTGDRLDAIAVLAVLGLNVAIGFATELRAHRAMEALLGLEVAQATVLRDGRPRQTGAALLVPGDVILLEAGLAVAADARLLDGADLQVTEAPLTGESLPAAKQPDAALDPATPLGDRVTMVFKGTTVADGTGRALVVATGMRTEIGRIGVLAAQVRPSRSPLERHLESLGRRLAVVACGAAGLTAVLAVAQGAPLAAVFATALALAVAAVPEGLPVVATITMAIGVHRMARRRALVRQLPAVETLGAATLICTDKTGTLTAGEMTVTEYWLGGRTIRVSGAGYAPVGSFSAAGRPLDPASDAHLLAALRIGAIANRARLTETPDGWRAAGDPTEAALLTAARKGALVPDALRAAAGLQGEVPFTSARMWMAVFGDTGAGPVAMLKGAPHRVAAACDRFRTAAGDVPMGPAERAAVEAANTASASRGLRVLALAEGRVARPDEMSLAGLTFVGLVGLLDPPAADVAATLHELRGAGLRTVMLTGDQRLTAEAVARDLGLLEGRETLDGADVDRLDDAALAARMASVGAVSRASPEAKLRLVGALQGRGEVVAMLGDGVNDAAALRRADIGVAMGGRGTDLAKEAADVILADDRFATIAAAVAEGRVVFANVRKFVFYLFSCNLAEILVVLVASAAGYPAVLLPLQILWLNLVTDTFPALALAVEPAEEDLMRRPPRARAAGVLTPAMMRAIVGYAVAIAAVTLAAFAWGLAREGGGPAHAATLAFSTLAVAQGLHLGNARSRAPVLAPSRALANRAALAALALVAALQYLAVAWPPLARLLDLTPLVAGDVVVIVALAAVPAVAGQLLKRLRPHAAPA